MHGLRFAYARADRLWTICPPSRKTPYFATTFRQKVHLFAPFLDSKVAPGASFWPFPANFCFYAYFCHRTSRRNKSWSKKPRTKLRASVSSSMINCHRKNKSVKKVPFFLVPAPAGRASVKQENQAISMDLASAELGSGSAELGSAPAELQILGKSIKILLKSSRSSLRAGSETRSSLLVSSAGLGSQNLGNPWKITGKS